jgi:hypothetical protein
MTGVGFFIYVFCGLSFEIELAIVTAKHSERRYPNVEPKHSYRQRGNRTPHDDPAIARGG